MSDRLYSLVPAVYRIRDLAEGEPLRALLGVVEEELLTLERDVEGLYDNWFIETCDEWVAPYIGDLLGIRGVYGEHLPAPGHRAWVANTLRYRRRKGLPSVLAYAAQDATGWRARVVEFFERLGTTQHVRHPRPGRGGCADLRRCLDPDRADGAWDDLAHSYDVRAIGAGRAGAPGGRYGLGQVGLFLWRLSAYPVQGGSARRVRPGGYTFHSLGVDTPLLNLPQTESDVALEPGERNVPGVLDRARLEAEAHALAAGDGSGALYFGSAPVLEVRIDGEPVPPEAICFQDLGEWAPPPAARRAGEREVPIRAAVDPERGRMTLPPGAEPGSVEVSYAYGFAGDVGGGPYDRRATLTPSSAGVPEWTVGARGVWSDPVRHFATLGGALEAWAQQGGPGVVRLVDDGTHSLESGRGFQALRVRGGHLSIEAVDGVHPTLVGNLEVSGDGPQAHLHLSGIRLDGTIRLTGAVSLHLLHCTLKPGAADDPVWRNSVEARNAGPGMRVVVERSITGPLSLPARIGGLAVRDSIVDGGFGYAVADGTAPHDDARPGPPSIFVRTTVLGMVRVGSIPLASGTIFQGLVLVNRDQEGMVEFCYVPPESQTPPRHRCQPDLALASSAASATAGNGSHPGEREQVLFRMRPRFTSTRYGDPGYAQLAPDCPPEIGTGARDGSEMGAFHHLQQPQREANLRAVLDEYLPYGVRAGIFYVT